MYGSKVKAGLEEAYKKEDTQRIFEIISKTLLEEVRVSGKITLDDFSYLVNNSLKNEELREKVIEKFEQNLEFVDMITREVKNITPDSNANIPRILPKLQTDYNVSPTTNNTPFTPFTPSTFEELNKEIKRNSALLSQIDTIQEENTTEKENLLEEKHCLLNQKAKHLKSLLNIAKNTPIFDVDVNKLHQDIETLDKDVKTLVEKAKDV